MIIITGAARKIIKTEDLEQIEGLEDAMNDVYIVIRDAAIQAYDELLRKSIEIFDFMVDAVKEKYTAPKMEITRFKARNQVTDRKPRHINRKIIQ